MKFLLDFSPLILFFLAFKIPVDFAIFTSEKPLVFATFVLGVSTLGVMIYSKLKGLQVDKLNHYTSIFIIIAATLTVILDNEVFIKMKLTVINLFFSAILFYSFQTKKLYLKSLMGEKIQINDRAWAILTIRFALLFLAIAIGNEFVWRLMSDGAWVTYKTFIVAPITMVFLVMQSPLIKNNTINGWKID